MPADITQGLHTSYNHHFLRDSTTYYTTSYHSHLLQHISTAIFTEQWMIGISYKQILSVELTDS